jgi:hypothetical protein
MRCHVRRGEGEAEKFFMEKLLTLERDKDIHYNVITRDSVSF